jgi:predicted RNase H-like HicB family nuclease
MIMTQEIAIDLIFERDNDGRYQVSSTDVPGFYMAGSDIEAIHGDLNEVVSDLLRLNTGFIVSDIRWVPSIDDVKKHLAKPPSEGKIRYVASGSMAA